MPSRLSVFVDSNSGLTHRPCKSTGSQSPKHFSPSDSGFDESELVRHWCCAMRWRPHFGRWARAAVLMTMSNILVRAQDIASETALSGDAPPDVVRMGTSSEYAAPLNAPCLEPPPFVRWDDYQGPFRNMVVAFTGKLELRSAHPPHYKAGTVLCSLPVKDKFMLFVSGYVAIPFSLLSNAFDAGSDQFSKRDPTFGQGVAGYGRRFRANFAQGTTSRFLSDFAYPTIFSEDPRYYRLPHGSARQSASSMRWSTRLWLSTTTISPYSMPRNGSEQQEFRSLSAMFFILGTSAGLFQLSNLAAVLSP